MNKGGTDGVPTSISSTTSASSTVVVHFPGDPLADPPVAPYDETYEGVTDPLLRRFEDVRPPRPKCNVGVDANGHPNAVAAHS